MVSRIKRVPPAMWGTLFEQQVQQVDVLGRVLRLKLILGKVNEMIERAVPLCLVIQACSLHLIGCSKEVQRIGR